MAIRCRKCGRTVSYTYLLTELAASVIRRLFGSSDDPPSPGACQLVEGEITNAANDYRIKCPRCGAKGQFELD